MTLTKYTVETSTGATFDYYAADEADARRMHLEAKPGDAIVRATVTPPAGAPLSLF